MMRPETGAADYGHWREELRAMLSLAWPLILSNLTMTLISATDVVLMGRLSPHALAASALGVNMSMLFNVFCWGLVQASSPLMASELGRRANSVRDVRRTFQQTLWLLAIATTIMLLILWNAAAIMIELGQDPALARSAGEFLRGYMWCQVPFLIFQVMRNFIAALQRPGWAMAVSIIGIFVNALVSWSLIFGKFGLPALGLFGGGLGSTITWTLIMLGMGIVLLRDPQFRRFRLFHGLWRPDWPRFKQLWKLGLPIAITYGFEGTVFSLGVYFMGLIDEVSVAAHAIALQLASITFMVPMGIAQATTVRVGYGHGARDAGAVTRAGWTGFALGVGFMALMGLVMLLFPLPLIGIFIDLTLPSNGPVVALALVFLGYAAMFQLFDGAQVVAAGMLRGLQDTRLPMLFAGLGYWVVGLRGGVWLAFDHGWKGAGIWTGFVAGLAIVSILMLWRWSLRDRLGLVPTAKRIPQRP
jgi:MATE family multidrug resistance protein